MKRTYNCRYCGRECTTRDKRSCHCCSPKCVQTHNRKRYKNKVFSKRCARCGAPFSGRYREINCPNCKQERNIEYKEFTVHDLCIHCGSPHKKRTVKFATDHQAKDRSKGVCPECRKLTGKRISDSRVGEKNPNWKGGKRPVLTPEEVSALNSERMKRDNPMKRPEVAAKVSRTAKLRPRRWTLEQAEKRRKSIEDGEIVYVIGKEHHLWKGMRKRSFTIRSRLYHVWVKPILARDNFRCTKCGCKDDLEVHHEGIPFRDVVTMFSQKPLEDLSQEEFELVSGQVVCYHVDHVQGITLCTKCHREVDPLRR